MTVQPSNRVTLRVDHVDYLLNVFGVGGLIGEFRAEDCHRFIQWLHAERERLKKDLPKDETVGILEVTLQVAKVAIFAFSKLAYKIVCDNHGRIIPANLLGEIQSLQAYEQESRDTSLRRFRGNMWDAYATEAIWVDEVRVTTNEMVEDILKTILESAELEGVDVEFNPNPVMVETAMQGVKQATSHDTVVIDLENFLTFFRQPRIKYTGPAFTETWQKYGWFSSHDWSIVLMAKIVTECAESYRLFMKRYHRRHQNIDDFERYEHPHSNGFLDMYIMLREKYVEPRFYLDDNVEDLDSKRYSGRGRGSL